MLVESNIGLELYWQGIYTYGNWDISVIDINMENSTHEISAHINTNLPSTNEQRLNFKVIKKEGSYFERNKECSRIECPIELLRSMSVSARIFQTYENQSMRIQQPNGSYKPEIRARRDNLPVFIGELPHFKPNKTYLIKIINQDNKLRATITKKASEVAAQTLLEKQSSQPTSTEQTKEFDQLNTGFEGFARMIEAASFSNQIYEDVETSELQNRLEQANQKLITARTSFDRACQSGNHSHIMVALNAKQRIMKEILDIQTTLQVRGIPQRDVPPQECLIS